MRPLLYIRFRPERLVVERVGSTSCFSDVPLIALDSRTHRVLAVGEAARFHSAQGVVIGNGFEMGRTILTDVDLAQIALRHAIRQVLKKRKLWLWSGWEIKPDLVLHPLSIPGDELTSVECYALERIGRDVGGRLVTVWVGRELSVEELLAGRVERHVGWVPAGTAYGVSHGA